MRAPWWNTSPKRSSKERRCFLDEYEDGDETVIELEVAEAEMGKVIGRSGASPARCARCWPQQARRTTSATRWRFSNSGTAEIEDAGGSWITLALVVKTQGRHGEVAVESHSDVPDRFRQGMRLTALLKSGERRELEIEELWPHKSWLVFKFAGVETMTDAEALKGAELQVPRSERAALEPGSIYLSDLIGCAVFDCGREIGPIVDVVFGAGEAPLLVVQSAEPKTAAKLPYEIPFAEAYLEKVDLERKQVRMKLPAGMLEVNAPLAREEKEERR